MTNSASGLVLLVRAGTLTCALPVSEVIEIMRPLPLEPLENAPGFVRGLSIIRGAPVPVVDLRDLLGTPSDRPAARFVTVLAGDRTVALAVDASFGIRELSPVALDEMPPLLQGGRIEMIEAIGVLDADLLLVLKACGIVSADVWNMLSNRQETA
jgi:purine-binding chemotaxis protein CheW